MHPSPIDLQGCQPDDATNPHLAPVAAYRMCSAAAPIRQSLRIETPDANGKTKVSYFAYYSDGDVAIEDTPPDTDVIITLHGATRVASQCTQSCTIRYIPFYHFTLLRHFARSI
jgi:hypothetical protein